MCKFCCLTFGYPDRFATTGTRLDTLFQTHIAVAFRIIYHFILATLLSTGHAHIVDEVSSTASLDFGTLLQTDDERLKVKRLVVQFLPGTSLSSEQAEETAIFDC